MLLQQIMQHYLYWAALILQGIYPPRTRLRPPMGWPTLAVFRQTVSNNMHKYDRCASGCKLTPEQVQHRALWAMKCLGNPRST